MGEARTPGSRIDRRAHRVCVAISDTRLAREIGDAYEKLCAKKPWMRPTSILDRQQSEIGEALARKRHSAKFQSPANQPAQEPAQEPAPPVCTVAREKKKPGPKSIWQPIAAALTPGASTSPLSLYDAQKLQAAMRHLGTMGIRRAHYDHTGFLIGYIVTRLHPHEIIDHGRPRKTPPRAAPAPSPSSHDHSAA